MKQEGTKRMLIFKIQNTFLSHECPIFLLLAAVKQISPAF
jgi:hypothetical protein